MRAAVDFRKAALNVCKYETKQLWINQENSGQRFVDRRRLNRRIVFILLLGERELMGSIQIKFDTDSIF